MRFRWMTAAVAALALTVASSQVSALTLPVIGGPGLDQGQICPTGSLCPGTPVFSLFGVAATTGSFTYNAGPGTVDFSLTLTAPANFIGGPVSILAGSTFSAVGVPVVTAPLGGGAFAIAQSGPATGSATLLLSSGLLQVPVTGTIPAISALSCTVGTGADQCGVSLGAAGLKIFNPTPATVYDVFVTFNVNVPEPTTALLVVSGLAGLVLAGRRRA